MTKRDVYLIGVWALATAGLTMGIMAPSSVVAKEEPTTKPAAEIATPTLDVNGVKVSVRMPGEDKGPAGKPVVMLAQGEVPKMDMVVTNTTSQTQTMPVQLAVLQRSAGAMMSRGPAPELPLYNEMTKVEVKPGETKVVTVTPKGTLAAGGSGTVRLTVGKQSLVAGRFSVPASKDANGNTVAVGDALGQPLNVNAVNVNGTTVNNGTLVVPQTQPANITNVSLPADAGAVDQKPTAQGKSAAKSTKTSKAKSTAAQNSVVAAK